MKLSWPQIAATDSKKLGFLDPIPEFLSWVSRSAPFSKKKDPRAGRGSYNIGSYEEWIRGSAPRTEGVDAEVRGIVKFLEEVDEYKPTVPEAVVRQYLQLGGTATDDPRTLKLVALATDNFLANVVKEARDIGKLRVGNKRPNPNGSGGGGEDPDADVPLTMEDIAESLRSKGIKITKPSSAVHSE